MLFDVSFPYWADKSRSYQRWNMLVMRGCKTFDEFKTVRVTAGGLPYVKPGSLLAWFPVVEKVCIFPVAEEMEMTFHDGDLHRPMFYSRIDFDRRSILNERLRFVRRHTKRKRL